MLEVNNIKKNYGNKVVLKDISLKIKEGEVVGLLGPNGAGKTTLFYAIVGMLKVDSGIIKLKGQDVTKFPMYMRAKLGIGYLPQENSIFRLLNVEENILAVLEIVEKNKGNRVKKLLNLLEEFSITHLRKVPALALSGGERRRVEIARCVACDPSFILLDEPFAGVDPIAVNDIMSMIDHLKNKGIGILITDHNFRETLKTVDKAYIVHDGKILTAGSSDEILSNEDVKKVYLGDNFL
ncbi:MAG: LPS export ABC transporter ATP-binding protein [Rickettsiales bacterium]|jgi:lipopolysaccharide export system ATP-binding protein|nr:LPS export ABC transporter ATP-binding protein [Rickettsiales bacterium]